MKEIPILMSTPMAISTIEGKKTETRRVRGLDKLNESAKDYEFVGVIHPSIKQKPQPVFRFKNKVTNDLLDVQCPYGQSGDLLWVRETWNIHSWCLDDGEMTVSYKAGGKFTCPYPGAEEDDTWIANQIEKLLFGEYFAPETEDESPLVPTGKEIPWKPSIHMPKDASRIWLQVKEIRIERLQSITESDAKAEGVKDTLKADEMKLLTGLGDWPILRPFSPHQFGFLSI